MRPILVDVTRTISRAFKPVPTGIDRVERAYIGWFSMQSSAWFVANVSGRIVVFDSDGILSLMACIDEREPWDQPNGLGWLWSLGGDQTIKRNATIKRLATWIFDPAKAPSALQDCIGSPGTYLNVGHTNLDETWLHLMTSAGGFRIVVMVHDMIPLDFPQYQTPKSVARFETRIRATAACADMIIANSKVTADRVDDWFARWGRSVPVAPIHLGITPVEAAVQSAKNDPYFIMLGTIEPRKNHELMLDVWDLLPSENRPFLHIVGARGWQNSEVFKRLDTSPLMGQSILEHGPLSDGRTQALLRGARGLLFPSLAEGFGIPVLEALQVHVPVLANRLPVLEEIAGPSVLYIDSHDANVWATIISRIANTGGATNNTPEFGDLVIPRWEDHFQQLMRVLA